MHDDEAKEFDCKWGINISPDTYAEDFSSELLSNYTEIYFEGWDYTLGEPRINTVWVKDAVKIHENFDNAIVIEYPYWPVNKPTDTERFFGFAEKVGLYTVKELITDHFIDLVSKYIKFIPSLETQIAGAVASITIETYKMYDRLLDATNPIVGVFPITDITYFDYKSNLTPLRDFFDSKMSLDFDKVNAEIHLDYIKYGSKGKYPSDLQYFNMSPKIGNCTVPGLCIDMSEYLTKTILDQSDLNSLSPGKYYVVLPNKNTLIDVPEGREIGKHFYLWIEHNDSPLNNYGMAKITYECPDQDEDGYPICTVNDDNYDCDDLDPEINPQASEVCSDGIDNNCDGEVDEGCLLSIPFKKGIVVNGSKNDWAEIKPFMYDPPGDSCGTGTDIAKVYLAKDNCYLYWRMDTETGEFKHQPTGSNNYHGPGLVFYSTENGVIQRGVEASIWSNTTNTWDMPIISERDQNTDWTIYATDQDYGAIGEIAEGKIPLELFEGYTFNPPLAWYQSETSGILCDEARASAHLDLNFDSSMCSGTLGPLVFFENWESGMIDPSLWDLGCASFMGCYRSEYPVVYTPGHISGFALNHNNETNNCNTAAHTVKWFNTSKGLQAEFWLSCYDVQGQTSLQWSTNSAGFTEMQLSDNRNCAGDNIYEIIAGVSINLLPNIISYSTNNGHNFSEDLPDRGWHKYKIIIDQSGYVSFYRDDQLKFTTSEPIDLSNYSQTKFQHYGQGLYGSTAVGAMLFDDLLIHQLEE